MITKILVVDDDERNLLALSEVLGPIAEVVTASSGRDALRLLLRQDFAVILLDVFMPGIDGYETAALIRQREQTARIPIIFLSAVNKETEHLMRGYEMGAVDYVFKPVDPLVLRSKVGVFVDLYRMRRQVEEQADAEQKLREANFQEQISRMEIERQLEDAERRQASILQALPLAIYEAEELPGKPIKRNFVGGDLSRFLGEKGRDVFDGNSEWEEWIHEEDRHHLRDRAKLGQGTETLEYRWVGPDGSIRYFLDHRVAVGTPADGPRWAGTVLDITERKTLEAQLVHIGKLDALGQLTGGVAHDFNNLLAAVLGGLHVLQRRLNIGEREQQVVDQMRHATEQGIELVRRMMAFARQQDLSPASIDPSSLCESVAGLVSHTLGGTVTVNWHCPDGHLNLFVDRNQLELAMMNLIINARDAMPSGGSIDVSIQAIEDAVMDAKALRIRVADNGQGIPEDMVARVTEPFFTTKETGKGTGLGLSMVAGFVHQSGGTLSIDSEPGHGTTIDLVLPATESAPAAQPEPRLGDAGWLANKRMMLIDDDDAVRLVLAEQFRDAGGQITVFSSGKDAIRAAGESPELYDFVLSDFAMPGMDGLATLREVRKLAPGARLALMTGYADGIALKEKPSFPIIRKPVDLNKVAAAFGA